jgi:hypothetical protein
MFDAIKNQLFTPSSIIIAVIYYLLAVGFVTTYDAFSPMFEQSKAVVSGKR